MNYHTGDIIMVTVTSIENYGIFVKVDDTYNGMIHISEMSDKFVSNVRNFAYPGETIYAKVIDVDSDKYQMKLSIKSIDYRLTSKKGRVIESPNGFSKLKEILPIWIDSKLNIYLKLLPKNNLVDRYRIKKEIRLYKKIV